MSKKAASDSKIVVDEKTLQGLPIGVMLFDIEKVYFANKTAAEILGLNKSKKDISKCSVFDFIENSFHNESKAYFNRILTKKKVSRREIILVTFSGKTNIGSFRNQCGFE